MSSLTNDLVARSLSSLTWRSSEVDNTVVEEALTLWTKGSWGDLIQEAFKRLMGLFCWCDSLTKWDRAVVHLQKNTGSDLKDIEKVLNDSLMYLKKGMHIKAPEVDVASHEDYVTAPYTLHIAANELEYGHGQQVADL